MTSHNASSAFASERLYLRHCVLMPSLNLPLLNSFVFVVFFPPSQSPELESLTNEHLELFASDGLRTLVCPSSFLCQRESCLAGAHAEVFAFPLFVSFMTSSLRTRAFRSRVRQKRKNLLRHAFRKLQARTHAAVPCHQREFWAHMELRQTLLYIFRTL